MTQNQDHKLTVPQGSFTLKRMHQPASGGLRAWDAADEYVLQHLYKAVRDGGSFNDRVLIVNDAFGALSTVLATMHPVMMSDSFVSRQELYRNLELNSIDASSVEFVDSLHVFRNKFSLIIIKIPRSLAMLEDQLYRIRNACSQDTLIIAAAMTKHIHTSTLTLFEKIIGVTTTSLAQKKARLVFSQFESNLSVAECPYPDQYLLPESGEPYFNHANVFSREKPDIGARFMLQHIPGDGEVRRIVDLACGNGILGIAAARHYPDANVVFADESYMAIESARHNVASLLGEQDRFSYEVMDCLQGIEDKSVDLILNNPPFHQQHVVGDFIAWQMFKQSRKKLRQNGRLRIVANRHLAYHAKLKRLFGNVRQIASNRKFVILESIVKS